MTPNIKEPIHKYIFVFPAYSKVDMYSKEEFEEAFGQFKSTRKPFIFIYFKTPPDNCDDSPADFKKRPFELKHFYANFNDINDLWTRFNKEPDRLKAVGVTENKRPEKESAVETFYQNAEKIYNIEKIERADFS